MTFDLYPDRLIKAAALTCSRWSGTRSPPGPVLASLADPLLAPSSSDHRTHDLGLKQEPPPPKKMSLMSTRLPMLPWATAHIAHIKTCPAPPALGQSGPDSALLAGLLHLCLIRHCTLAPPVAAVR